MNKIGLSSNKLKLVAIITMIIDHIGYYFHFIMTDTSYLSYRIIGRISMPIFVFLIVQGYFHTKSLKKYILRLSLLAIITQVAIFILGYLNLLAASEYIVNISKELNILFSFVLILITLYSLDNIIWKNNIFVNVILILSVLTIYINVPIDYGFICLVIGLCFYLVSKIKNSNIVYTLAIIISITLLSLYLGDLYIFMILSIPFILLYNNKLGIKLNISKSLIYIIFPLQHTILYALGIFIFRYLNT